MDDSTKNIFDVVIEVAKLIGLIVAGVWAYWRYFLEGSHKPRIELDVQCTFFEKMATTQGVFFTVRATNKGNVEHKFTRISLRVLGVKRGQSFTRRTDGRWNFPEPILKAELITKEEKYYFVRPGISQPFLFPSTIPSDIDYILVRAGFKYEWSNDLHTIEQVFKTSPSAKVAVEPVAGA